MVWTYSLTPEEEGICAKVGYLRQEPYLGNPWHNTNYSEGDASEMWQHAVCAGSELAFARMLGLTDFVPHVNKWKTELDLPGWGEVRFSYNASKNGLRFTTRDNPENKYVLITGGLSIMKRRSSKDNFSSPPYVAVGWMYGHECMRDEWESIFGGRTKTWYVPVECLHSMDTIEDRM